MQFLNLADRSQHWFIFLTFTNGRGWAWSEWKWITAFQALSAAAAPGPGVTDFRVYWWDGSGTALAFTK
jgi:hypothetical protein